jgi:hypothetical protein
MPALKRNEISEKIKLVKFEIERWRSADNPRVEWRGGSVKCVTERLSQTIQDLFDFVARLDIEQDAKKLVLKIDEFQKVVDDWAVNSIAIPEDTHPGGSTEMWGKWELVVLSANERARTKPPSIESLDNQKISDIQIAMMYDWKDANDEWDLERVYRERAEPGSEYDASTWVSPFDAKETEETNAAWAVRTATVRETPATANRVRTDAPESIYELLQQRVSSKQILLMKPTATIEGIHEVAIAHGLPVDGMQVERDSSAASTGKPKRVATASKSVAKANGSKVDLEIDDLEKRTYLISGVKELQQAGKTPEQIVVLFAEDFPELTAQQVVSILQEESAESLVGL